VHSHPEIVFTIGKQIARRLRNTTDKVDDLAFYDVTGHIACSLIELSKKPDGMQIKITRRGNGRLGFKDAGGARSDQRVRQNISGLRNPLVHIWLVSLSGRANR
jgi:CRP-like cAMP-binding protein